MSTVLLVRHGRSTANADGILAGRNPGIDLDDRGREQATAVGERLAEAPLAAVVSSPMERCQQTAGLIRPDLPPVLEDRLTECDYGAWSGRKLTELAGEELWRTVQSQPSAARFPEGESLPEMAARSVQAIRDWDERITAEHGPDAMWLAVSHGDVIKSIVADALGLHLDLYQRVVVDPASVTIIQYAQARPSVLSVNVTGREIAALVQAQRERAEKAAKEAAEGKESSPQSGDAVVGGRDA